VNLSPTTLALRLFVKANTVVWHRLPSSVTTTPRAQHYGVFLQRLVRKKSRRFQNPRTYFLRNRPELEVICKLANERPHGSTLKISVLACSMGAEVFTILHGIKTARPDIDVRVRAFDISREVLMIANEGLWTRDTFQLERLTPGEIDHFFDPEGDKLRVKQWLRNSVEFELADATDPALATRLGPQDLVIANRFLCHMQPAAAEAALRAIAKLVAPQGYLVCSGVDVDVRTSVMRSLGWLPITEQIEAIHEGDHTLRDGFPLDYWGLEPLDKRRSDWQLRYATIFQRP
jgi:chemotaxis methyl-accepting protein methylase